MAESRSRNTKRNIVTGLISQFATILLPFLIRTALLYEMGEQFVGLSSLFASILQVLNLAEMGFANAIVYNMYQPIAEGDTDEVCRILSYYRKIYTTIGCIVLVGGLCVLPFLPNLINGTWPDTINIYWLYLMYLANSVTSYFMFAYKTSLLAAVQRLDINNTVSLAVHVLQYLMQLGVIIFFKNYYLYYFFTILATIAINIISAIISNRLFPLYQCNGMIASIKKREIRKQVTGLMIGRLSDISRNSFDSIVLSVLFGLTTVAIYNNYYYVFTSLYAVLNTVARSMQASVGNSIVLESKEKNLADLRKFQFIFMWLVGIFTVCMFCLYQPFMVLWAGEKLKFSNLNMTLFCIYFYTINMNTMRNVYFEANGLWWNAKKTFVLESVFNLLLNFGLGYFWGVTGVLLATIVTIIAFNFVARTNILFKKYFRCSPWQFYREHIVYLMSWIICALLAMFACDFIKINNIFTFCLKGIICVFISTVVIILLTSRSEEFKTMKAFLYQQMMTCQKRG